MVEMMAVIFIIGLLMATVTVAVLKHLERARKTTTGASMMKIKEAVQMYKMYKGRYPDSLSVLVPEYIEEESKLKDGWKNDFYYSVPGDHGEFDLISGGSDGDINTPDDNVNVWKMDDIN